MGETTAAIAQARPEDDFLGIEVHAPGVGSLLKRIRELGLTNVRVIRHDAVEVVAAMIPPSTLAGVQVFFPDPWPKKRHHKRRLLTPAFVRELALRLVPGGYLHVATDWDDYAQEILAVLAAEPLLANTATGFAPRPDYRPLTKFEARGLKLGHSVRDLVFRRRAAGLTWRSAPDVGRRTARRAVSRRDFVSCLRAGESRTSEPGSVQLLELPGPLEGERLGVAQPERNLAISPSRSATSVSASASPRAVAISGLASSA